MAKRDVVKYFLDMQASYFELVQTVKDIEADYKNNLMTREQYETIIAQSSADIENIKANYDRVAYIMMLLNKPIKQEKREKEEKRNKDIYTFLEGAALYNVKLENKAALDAIKRVMKETYKGDN